MTLIQVDEVLYHVVGDGEIDHPVHEVEGEEGDGEHDAAVLVNITGLYHTDHIHTNFQLSIFI